MKLSNRSTLLLSSVLLLGGCAAIPSTASYRLDLADKQLCIGQTQRCYALSLIGPSYRERDIARAFGLPSKHYSWSDRQLAELLLNPPDNSYQPVQLSATSYQLPAQGKVALVWRILEREDYELYGDDDDLRLIHRR